MARGVDGRTIFETDQQRSLFLTILESLRKEHGFSILAYCLMGNHFHLALRVSQVPLSRTMQRLLTRYAIAFNAQTERTGHLFQARFKASLCTRDRYLISLVRYIHHNPVRAGIALHPCDWHWSSYNAYSGRRQPVQIDSDPAMAAVSGEHSALGVDEALDGSFEPWPKAVTDEPTLLRGEESERPSIETLAAGASQRHGVSIEEMKSSRRERRITAARRSLLEDAVLAGHPLSAASVWMGCTRGSAHVLLYGRRKSTKSNA